MGCVRESLLPWKRNKYYILVPVYPSAWACTYEWVNVALLIQHEKRMRHIVTSNVALQALSHKRRDFKKKKVTEHKMFVLIFSTTFV
jgi:hypothetical protein